MHKEVKRRRWLEEWQKNREAQTPFVKCFMPMVERHHEKRHELWGALIDAAIAAPPLPALIASTASGLAQRLERGVRPPAGGVASLRMAQGWPSAGSCCGQVGRESDQYMPEPVRVAFV